MKARRPRNATRPEPPAPTEDVGQTYLAAPLVDTQRQILDIEVVPELCMSFLNCMRIARGAFARQPQSGKTGPARWRQADPAALWKAAWSCPSGAIRFITASGYVNPHWEEATHWRTHSHPASGRRRPEPTTD